MKLGLALGSGAARGLAHIGVLKVFEEEGIRVDCIAGTSIGAFIGALYAAGVPVGHMEEVARNVDWRRLAKLIDPVIPTTGIIDGKKVARFMEGLLPARTFEELHTPLAVTATDVETGELLVIKKGNLQEALRAALAFPGIFTPVRFGDRFLVDGGLCNPVPVDVVRDLGAVRIIGVCAIPEVQKRTAETFLPSETPSATKAKPLFDFFNSTAVEKLFREMWPGAGKEEKNAGESVGGRERKPPGILKVCAQSVAIMENEINALRLRHNNVDLLIRPELNGITLLEFHRAGEAIEAGEKAARPLAQKIKALCGRN